MFGMGYNRINKNVPREDNSGTQAALGILIVLFGVHLSHPCPHQPLELCTIFTVFLFFFYVFLK